MIWKKPIPDPGSRGQKGTGSRIRIRNTGAETRETGERLPLLTVETEVNGDSKSTNYRVIPWLVRWTCRAGTRDFCPALAARVGPVQKYFFLAVHYF